MKRGAYQEAENIGKYAREAARLKRGKWSIWSCSTAQVCTDEHAAASGEERGKQTTPS